MAKIIRANGKIEELDMSKFTDDDRLEKMQEVVGGLIEILYVFENDQPKIMIINEEGKLIGLPINPEATEIAQSTIGIWDSIMGDVIVCESEEVP